MADRREGTYTLMELPNGVHVMMSETELASYRTWLKNRRVETAKQQQSKDESKPQKLKAFKT